MARLIMAALAEAGYAVSVMSDLRALDTRGASVKQQEIAHQAEQEVTRILAAPPDLVAWVTYHLYYKAPDLIGPKISQVLDIPYIVLEPSYAAKRAEGPWAGTDAAVRQAFDQATVLATLTRYDQESLWQQWGSKVAYLPPFLEAQSALPRQMTVPPRLLAVGMLRPGDKQASYTVLAAWLQSVTDLDWIVEIAGDGAARAEVQQAFAPLGDRVQFLGQVTADQMPAVFARATAVVWPAVNEAYGMALLEAQAAGIPVVACAVRGVPDVVASDGAILVPEGDGAAFADAIRTLLQDPQRAQVMGQSARRWVTTERTTTQAAQALKSWIEGTGS